MPTPAFTDLRHGDDIDRNPIITFTMAESGKSFAFVRKGEMICLRAVAGAPGEYPVRLTLTKKEIIDAWSVAELAFGMTD